MSSARPIQTAPPVTVRSTCHSPSPRASSAGWPGRGRSASARKRQRLLEGAHGDRLAARLGGRAGERGAAPRPRRSPRRRGERRALRNMRQRRGHAVSRRTRLAPIPTNSTAPAPVFRARSAASRSARSRCSAARRRDGVDLRERLRPAGGAGVLDDRRHVPVRGQHRHLRVGRQLFEEGVEHGALAPRDRRSSSRPTSPRPGRNAARPSAPPRGPSPAGTDRPAPAA